MSRPPKAKLSQQFPDNKAPNTGDGLQKPTRSQQKAHCLPIPSWSIAESTPQFFFSHKVDNTHKATKLWYLKITFIKKYTQLSKSEPQNSLSETTESLSLLFS